MWAVVDAGLASYAELKEMTLDDYQEALEYLEAKAAKQAEALQSAKQGMAP